MASKAVAERQQTLASLIQSMKGEIAKALPAQMRPERMARIATTVVRQTPLLAQCTPESFLGALLTASQLGLEPGPIGEAYFVPFNTKGGMVCQFIPGYRGLIKLARNSGQLIDIWAEIVYENDHFKYTLGLRRDIEHEPAEGERGNPIYVYAAAKLKDGGTPFVVLTHAEVEAIRARSKAKDNGPWVTDWAAMARKTAVKQLSKWLPLSAEFNTAAVLDGSVRTDVGPLDEVQPDFVDGEVVGGQAEIEADPGRGGGNEQGQGAEPSSGADILPDSADQDPPPDEVYAGRAELNRLAAIRKAEKYNTDAEWFDFVAAATGVTVDADKQLTMEQARHIISIFDQDQGGAE